MWIHSHKKEDFRLAWFYWKLVNDEIWWQNHYERKIEPVEEVKWAYAARRSGLGYWQKSGRSNDSRSDESEWARQKKMDNSLYSIHYAPASFQAKTKKNHGIHCRAQERKKVRRSDIKLHEIILMMLQCFRNFLANIFNGKLTVFTTFWSKYLSQ